MKFSLLALLAVPLAQAHTGITKFFVNGVTQGDGTCLRHPQNPGKWTFPVSDLQSPDVACGIDGTKPAKRSCPVPDGATLTFEYHMTPENPYGGVLDPSHKGPCAVYLKRVDNALYDGAAGDGWFKIWDHAHNGDKWCTVALVDNGGQLTVTLPKGLVGGYYLVRAELLALHNANQGDPQLYLKCAQIYLESSGDLVPETTVSMPGYCAAGEAPVAFNIYNKPPSDYYPPGPSPANLVSSGFSNTSPMPEGGKPDNCILEVGNWCGTEVADYSDSKGCWASTEACWRQSETCYKSETGPFGILCNTWKDKCNTMNDHCNAQDFYGPPSKGQDLTPTKYTIDPPPPLGPTRSPVPGDKGYGNAVPYQPSPPPYQPAPPASSKAPGIYQAPPVPAPSSPTPKTTPTPYQQTFWPIPTEDPSPKADANINYITHTAEVEVYETSTAIEYVDAAQETVTSSSGNHGGGRGGGRGKKWGEGVKPVYYRA